MFVVPTVSAWIAILKRTKAEDEITLTDLIQPKLVVIYPSLKPTKDIEWFCVKYNREEIWLHKLDIIEFIGE